jgi:hypothetical protein
LKHGKALGSEDGSMLEIVLFGVCSRAGKLRIWNEFGVRKPRNTTKILIAFGEMSLGEKSEGAV